MSTERKKWIIDRLFPAREVHLIGGPSGVGKTTWLFQMLADWKEGKPILGYESFPGNFTYVSCDRSNQSVAMTMERVKTKFPCFSIIENDLVGVAYTTIINKILLAHPETELLVMDGLTSLCPEGKINDYQKVSFFLSGLTKVCNKKNITMMGTVHTTKTKEGERILNPRQKIIGSTAWASYSDTICIIDPSDATDESSKRILEIMPRNSKHIRKLMNFSESGVLEYEDTEAQEENAGDFVIEANLGIFQAGMEIPFSFFQEKAAESKIPTRTLERTIARLVKLGRIEHVRRGVYRVPHAN